MDIVDMDNVVVDMVVMDIVDMDNVDMDNVVMDIVDMDMDMDPQALSENLLLLL